jgi:hypothetical protein
LGGLFFTLARIRNAVKAVTKEAKKEHRETMARLTANLVTIEKIVSAWDDSSDAPKGPPMQQGASDRTFWIYISLFFGFRFMRLPEAARRRFQ